MLLEQPEHPGQGSCSGIVPSPEKCRQVIANLYSIEASLHENGKATARPICRPSHRGVHEGEYDSIELLDAAFQSPVLCSGEQERKKKLPDPFVAVFGR